MPELAERALLFRRRSLWVAVVPVAIAVTQLAGSAFAISSLLPLLAAFLFCALGVFALPIALYRAWRFESERRGALLGLLLMLSITVSAFAAMMFLSWPLRRMAFLRAAERANTLIAAIKAFERAQGRPPQSLAELVPGHLVAIPGTGLLEYRTFEYQLFGDSGGSILWWDMGSRRGAAMTGLWVYPDGDPDRAILALELDGRDVVVEARMDRMPAATQQRAFSAEAWRANGEQRLHMVHDLGRQHHLRGKERVTIEELLGAPSGRRILRDSPWELRIPSPQGILNWDVFFYWPTERYPELLYGGRIERIGRWAYVHE